MADAERRRGRAERHRRRSAQAVQKGDFAQARKHGYLLLEEIGQVRAADPGKPEDTVVEAGAFYNMAAVEDQLGRTTVAVECARKALDLYAGLGVVGRPAEIAMAAGLEAVTSGFVRPPGVPPLTELATSAADAQARLARLLAKASGPAAAQEVGRLGADAVETYKRLIAAGQADMDGLRYVVTQYAVARDTVARGYLAAGEQDRAVALFQDVQTDCERVLGADHPVTAAARSNLTEVRR